MPIPVAEFQTEKESPYISPSQRFNRGFELFNEPEKNLLAMNILRQQLIQHRIQNQYLEREKQGELLKTNLANQLSKMTMPYEAPKMQAETQKLLSEARKINFNVDNPLIGLPGEQGNIGAEQYLTNPQNNKNREINNNSSVLSNTGGVQTNLNQPVLPLNNKINDNVRKLGAPGEQINAEQQDKLKYLLNDGKSTGNLAQRIRDASKLDMDSKNIRMELNKKKIAGYDFKQLGPNQRDAVYAQTNAFGIEPTEVAKYLDQGKTLSDLAYNLGYGGDPKNWPEPIPNTTPQQRNLAQQRTAALAELHYMEPFMSKYLSPYVSTYKNYSFKQILNAARAKFTKDEKGQKEQGRFIAAMQMMPDFLTLRGRGVGIGQVGIGVLNHLGETTVSKFDANRLLMTPDEYRHAMEATDEAIAGSGQRANEVLSTPFPEQRKQLIKNQGEFSPPEFKKTQKVINMYDKNGNPVNINSEDLEEGLKLGLRYKK